MSAATGTLVRLRRARTGISHRGDIDVPAGTIGAVVGPWVTDDGHVCDQVWHVRADVVHGFVSLTVHLPVTEDDIEEVAGDE